MQDNIRYPGLKLGEYNPDFKDLLKNELERQINEKKSIQEHQKQTRLAADKEKLKRLNESTRKTDQDALNYQISMKKKLKDMVKGNYDKAWQSKERHSHLKLVDRDYVPELDFAAQGLGIGHTHDAAIDTPTRIKKYHQMHNVNRHEDAEDDYWFVKQLNEKEHEFMHTEEKTKQNMRNAMEKMMHDDVNQHTRKVIVGSKLRHKH